MIFERLLEWFTAFMHFMLMGTLNGDDVYSNIEFN